MQVLSKAAATPTFKGHKSVLYLPKMFVQKAGLKVCTATLHDESGGSWPTSLCPHRDTLRVNAQGWKELSIAMNLQADMAVCITALSPSQLKVTRLTATQSSALRACHRQRLLLPAGNTVGSSAGN